MIELHLYGDLRRHAQEKTAGGESVLQLSIGNSETVGGVLRQVGIDPAEVGQVFLNGRLLNTRCSMAFWLGYQSAKERVPIGGSYLDAPVRSGDRLGVFPTKMAMLVYDHSDVLGGRFNGISQRLSRGCYFPRSAARRYCVSSVWG